MTRLLSLGIVVLTTAPALAGDKTPPPLVTGLENPQAVVVSPSGRIYVTASGDKDGEGEILRVEQGKAILFAKGLDGPRGITVFNQWLFAVDRQGVRRIDGKGKVDLVVPNKAFPSPPRPPGHRRRPGERHPLRHRRRRQG